MIGLGIICTGLFGNIVIQRVGRWKALWLGAFGMSLGALLLVVGRTPAVTISATFLMGSLGSLLLVLVPLILSDQYGPLMPVAYSEANFVASAVITICPLLVAWFASRAGAPLGGWRMALLVALIAPFLARLWFGKHSLPGAAGNQPGAPAGKETSSSGPLPWKYWVYWAALVMAVSSEFCMIYWSADYLEKSLGFTKATAALSVSVFLGGMILGRLIVSRLVQRFPAKNVILLSLLFAGLGFAFFWRGLDAIPVLAGLFFAGLGIAGLYPLIHFLALDAGKRNITLAAARNSLASGVAILSLPLVLARLADLLGIRLAYGVMILLLLGVFLIIVAEYIPAQKQVVPS